MADYFSRLPELLIHHILSSLPFNEIGRTCVLSKYFNSIWSNYPNLDFSFENTDLGLYFRDPLIEQEFWDRIENSLGKCLVRRRFIQQLSLEIISKYTGFNHLTTKLDRWLCLSLDKNVSRLVFRPNIRHSIYYSVPHRVLVAKRLEVLDVCLCFFKEDSFVRVELPRLEKLCLFRCTFVGDNLLQKILFASPKMKHISVEDCSGLGKSLSIPCTPLLKHFELIFKYNNEFERIKIDAPNLHTFSYLSHTGVCAIDLTTCTNVKELYLCQCVDKVFQQLHSIFLGIQVLEFSRCFLEKEYNYKICSPSLKRLILRDSKRFNDIEIDAPNLQSFEFSLEYISSSMLKFSSLSIPKVDDIHLNFSSYRSFHEACNTGLHDFLMKLPNYEDLKVLIYDKPYNFNLIMIVELHALSFYSLQEFANNSNMEIVISSRDETNLVHKVSPERFRYGYTISMLCNSWQSAECYGKKFASWSMMTDKYGRIELVSPADIQSYKWKSFVKSNSRGINLNGAMFLHASKG